MPSATSAPTICRIQRSTNADAGKIASCRSVKGDEALCLAGQIFKELATPSCAIPLSDVARQFAAGSRAKKLFQLLFLFELLDEAGVVGAGAVDQFFVGTGEDDVLALGGVETGEARWIRRGFQSVELFAQAIVVLRHALREAFGRAGQFDGLLVGLFQSR